MNQKKQSKITVTVDLDENKIPEKLSWKAEEGSKAVRETKALLLSVWDVEQNQALRIDLWTKDMPLDHMKVFFHHSLLGMSDTFFKATSDEKMRDTMLDFCDYFAEKMGLKN